MQTYLMSAVILLLLSFSSRLIASEKANYTLKMSYIRDIPVMEENEDLYDSGYVAEINEIPYIVALDFKGAVSLWFCAGSIIAHRWIVTVASCTHAAQRVKISYGSANRLEPFQQTRVSSRCFFPHPFFQRTYKHDIALIQTPYMQYSRFVKPVGLPKYKAIQMGIWLFSSGWGQHTGGHKKKDQLHVVQLQLQNNTVCVAKGYDDRFLTGMTCAVLPNKETGCRLDSGSPMVSQAQPYLIGIASFGNATSCRSNTPLGYTRISSYMKWMKSVMSENG